MRRGTHQILLSAPLLAACVLTGCSGSPGAAEPDRTSPLTAYFGAAYGADLSEDEQQKQFQEQHKRLEDSVAQCMKEQGFEYRPSVLPGAAASSGEDWNFDSREFVSQYGYGVVNQPGGDESEGGAAEELEDPNAAYVASLSDSERTAYYEALSGPQHADNEADAMQGKEQEYDWTTAGCSGKAQHEVMDEDPLQSDEHKGLIDAVNEFYEGQASWPEMAELNSAWSTCMTEAGQPAFTAQTDAQHSIYEKQTELQESVVAEGEVDRAALHGLGEQEMELALADFDCRAGRDHQCKH